MGEEFLAAVAGTLPAIAQDSALATQAPPIRREQLWLDWTRSSVQLLNQVRAYAPNPSAVTRVGKRRLKLLEARLGTSGLSGPPGLVLAAPRAALEVACGAGTLEIRRAQLEGGKPQTARELQSGRLLLPGQQLTGTGGDA